MEYYFSKINDSFENAIEKVTAALKVEGFGVLTEIDLKATLKETGCILQLHHSGSLQSGFRLQSTTGRR
jgi:uncharacterized protein (DUF302 family)